jgi:subtilisin family serine protease
MKRLLILVGVLCLVGTWSAEPVAQRGPTLASDLRTPRHGERMRVIVQGGQQALGGLRGRLAGLLRRDLGDSLALDVTPEEFERLKRDGSIAHISADTPVMADMVIANRVTDVGQVWSGTGGGGLLGSLLGGIPGYDGTGVTVAVLDSGIAAHRGLGRRVIGQVNMVSWEAQSRGDAFGHGTHIAGAVAGAPTSSYGAGSAPGVRLVDVRVLGSNGMGLTSDVIAGIDWVIANRTTYGIRVIAMALGHPVFEPAATDPLVRAAERAVAAGIVVVVSAGNYGKTSTGAPVLGGITSPGNSPAVITVGALETRGTVDRHDDRVADYSSRGPTRYDMAVKPDIVAPGSRVVSLEAADSYISRNYPQWHVGGSGQNAYMRLSGTSMATGVVAGGAALLLDAHPNMTPAQVKAALQVGASYMPKDGLIAAGTGSTNFASSIRIAHNGLGSGLLTTVTSLLGLSSGATYHDSGRLIDRLYDRTGIKLLGLLDLGALLAGPGGEDGVLQLVGLGNPLADAAPNYLLWGEVADWSSSYYFVWGNTIQHPSGQYFVGGNNEFTESSYFVWGNSVDPDGR